MGNQHFLKNLDIHITHKLVNFLGSVAATLPVLHFHSVKPYMGLTLCLLLEYAVIYNSQVSLS